VEQVDTDETIGWHWYYLEPYARRQMLLDTGTTVTARRDANRELIVSVDGHQILPGLDERWRTRVVVLHEEEEYRSAAR
jgi:hypothetical protein